MAIAGVSEPTVCQVHQKIFIRRNDGAETCYDCMTGKPEDYKNIVMEIWPPDMSQFFRSTGRKHDILPPHDPDCPAPARHSGPKIASPARGGSYAVAASIPVGNQKIPLKARAGTDAKIVYWFVGEELVAQGAPEETYFWNPKPGTWKISLVDSRGRSDQVRIEVHRARAETLLAPKKPQAL